MGVGTPAATLPHDDARLFERVGQDLQDKGFFVDQSGACGQLGPLGVDVADDLRPGVLRDRDDARRGQPL